MKCTPKVGHKKNEAMEEKLSKRLHAVQLYQFGLSAKKVAKRLHCDHHDVVIWTKRYQAEGEKGLITPSNWQFTADEKTKIVSHYLKKDVPLYNLCAQFKISYSTMKRWVREYQIDSSKSCKQKNFKQNTVMGRNKKTPSEPQTELERLQCEVKYLRAENALLKKVRTLMQTSRRIEHGQLPSKH